MHVNAPFDIEFSVVPPYQNKAVGVGFVMASEDGVEEMADMMECVVGLAALGAFATEEDACGEVGASWRSEGMTDGARWQRSLAVHRVRPSFWRNLFQMFIQCHYHLAAVERLACWEEGQHHAPVAVHDLFRAPYLRHPERWPFQCAWPDEAQTDGIVIRLTTAHPIDDEVFSAIQGVVEDWGSLVYVGGFADPGQPIDAHQLARIDVGRIHDSLVECAVVGWNAPNAALDTLTALCCGIHRTIVPIAEIEVD